MGNKLVNTNLLCFVRTIRDIIVNKIIGMRLELKKMDERLVAIERLVKDEMSYESLQKFCETCPYKKD